jgi:hypothetical protein
VQVPAAAAAAAVAAAEAAAAAAAAAGDDKMEVDGSNLDGSKGPIGAKAGHWIDDLRAKQKFETLAAAAGCISRLLTPLGLTPVPQPAAEDSSSQPMQHRQQKGQRQAKEQRAKKSEVQFDPRDGSCKVVCALELGDNHRNDADASWRYDNVYEGGKVRMVFDAHLEQQQQRGKLVLKVTGWCEPGGNCSTTGDSPAGQLRLEVRRVLAGILLWLYKPVRGLTVHWEELADVCPAEGRRTPDGTLVESMGVKSNASRSHGTTLSSMRD